MAGRNSPALTRPEATTPQGIPMPGELADNPIIRSAEVAFATKTTIPGKSVDEVWAGNIGLTYMGDVSSQRAGVLFPKWLDPVLMEDLRSRPPGDPASAQLKPGSEILDGHGEDKTKIIYLDLETRTLAFEAKWPGKKGRKGLQYVWLAHARKRANPSTVEILTASYLKDSRRPRLAAKLGPIADRLAMGLMAERLSSDDTDPETEQKHTIGRLAVAGVAAGLKTYRSLRKNSGHHTNSSLG
jgi:hypothetical protein